MSFTLAVEKYRATWKDSGTEKARAEINLYESSSQDGITIMNYESEFYRDSLAMACLELLAGRGYYINLRGYGDQEPSETLSRYLIGNWPSDAVRLIHD